MIAREVIGQPECPLMHRWTLLNVRVAKLLLHHFLPTVRDRDPHDHPRSFVTFVFRGGYDDISPCEWCRGEKQLYIPGASGYDENGTKVGPNWHWIPCLECRETGQVIDQVRAPALRYRPATHAHITVAGPSGAWSLVVMGPLVRAWGFLHDGSWWPWPEYEARYGGSFRCE